MPETLVYAPGTPMWVDLSSSNADGSRMFYTGLFGWTAEAGPPEAGGYTLMTLDGKQVCGIGPKVDPSAPAAWNSYFCSDRAEATTQKVRAAGGKELMEPIDVIEGGRIA